MKPLRWQDIGTIENARMKAISGVYLLVHQGRFNRVVYVGTSNNIGRRVAQHFEAYHLGNRTVWRVHPGEDIYALMSALKIKNYVNYYRDLSKRGLLWASTAVDVHDRRNLFEPGMQFSEDWLSFVSETYLPNIKVWALRLHNYHPVRAAEIESAIQHRLSLAFGLRSFFNHNAYSLLGKIEFYLRRPIRVAFDFENVPDLDDVSRRIFRSLDIGALPDGTTNKVQVQLNDVLQWRQEVRERRQKQTRKQKAEYARHGKQWRPVDQEKLRVMLVEFEMTPDEMAVYLERPAGAIAARIERNDKLTGSKWRKEISHLF